MRLFLMVLTLALAGQQSTSTRNGVLAGQLNTPEGRPAATTRVAAMAAPEPGSPVASSTSTLVSIGQTDANGRFRLEDVPPGRYYIVAGQVEFPTYYPGVVALSAATPISVTAGAASPALDFALSRANQDGAIEATVSVLGTNAPLAGAQLTLRSPNATSVLTAGMAYTDADGRATFRNLSPGQYTVQAQMDGYLGLLPSGITNLATPVATIAAITIAPGQPPQKLSMSLVRGTTISGRITDGNGMPITGLRVSAATLNVLNGRRTLATNKTAQTDDRGQYRLFWMGAGEYYIVAESLPQRGTAAQADLYRGTYYPGALDIAKAKPVVIRGSDAVGDVDFSMQKVKTYHVTGKVLNPPTRTLPNGQTDSSVPSFAYASRDSNVPDSSLAPPLIQNLRPDSGGEFDILVPPGAWNLFPVISLANPTRGTPAPGLVTTFTASAAPRYITGRAEIDVVDKDVNGVTITLTSADVKGRVVMPANSGTLPNGFSLQQIRPSLQPRESIPSPLLTSTRIGQTLGANGEFEFPGVPPGRYSFQVSLPSTLYIADIRVGAKSIYDDGILTVGSGPIDAVEIVLGSGAVAINGNVVGFTPETTIGALTSTRVVLAPAVPRRQNTLLYKTTNVTALNGGFYLFGVSPGDFKIFAFQGLPNGTEQDPAVIARYESRGRAITVTAGQTLTNIQVDWIPNAK